MWNDGEVQSVVVTATTQPATTVDAHQGWFIRTYTEAMCLHIFLPFKRALFPLK